MSKLILIRGLPASGKTTLAKKIANFEMNTTHIEADMYHIDEENNYSFDVDNIKDAHKWCQDTARCLMRDGQSVIVSNTFTQHWEMQPYFDMLPSGFELEIYRCEGKYENTHNVPKDVIETMSKRFETVAGEVFNAS